MPTENNIYLASGGTLALAFGTSATKIYGSIDADTVTIAAGVTAVLDGSFNRGNDVIKFAGNAASYSIVRVNASTVKITDALGTSVTIPVGSAGTQIQFADATRTLSGSAAGIVLGDQSVTAVATALTAGTAPPAVENYTLTVNSPSVTEGDSGTKTMSYKLTLDKAPTSTVTVNYETLDTGSATANDDFVPMAGTVTFAAGQTVAFVTVTVIGDTTLEAPETVKLSLSGSKLVASVEATGTIIDNEVAPVDPTSYIVTSGQIATADAQQVPITVNVGDTGNKTVTIQSDANAADRGVIINGNATVTVTAGAAGDIISVSGNANNTIDAGVGTGNDEVYIYGSGNNTVFVGSGDDKVFGGSGNDTIVVGAGNLGAGDVFDGGAGVDTVRISGDGNVAIFGTGVGTNLRSIENLVLDGTSVTIAEDNLEAAIAAGLIKIEGHPGTSVITITGANGASIDLTGLNLTGIKELKVDVAGAGGAASIKLSAAQIAAIGTITEIAGETLTVNTTVAGYQALGTKAAGATVTLTDTVQNLIAAGNSISGVTAVLGNATVAEAQSALSSGLTVSYTLVDTAANLALAPVAVFDSATGVVANTSATAAQASALASLLTAGSYIGGAANLKYSVSDRADMLATFTNGLSNATKVTATTVANEAQASAIYNAAAGGVATTLEYAVKDTANALDNSTNNTALNAASSVTIDGAATVVQVKAINDDLLAAAGGLTKVAAGYSLADAYSAGGPDNDLTDSPAITAAAGLITASGALSVFQVLVLDALQNTGATSYALSDTIGTLLGASATVRGAASAVAYTGGTPLSVSDANGLASLYSNAQLNAATIQVSDTVANLLLLSPAAIAAADTISISSGTGTVQQIVDLAAKLGAKMPGTYAVSDDVAAVGTGVGVAGTLTLLNAAASVAVTGDASVKQISDINAALLAQNVAVGSGLTAVAVGYTLADSALALLKDAAALAILDNAATVKVTGTATLPEIDQIADAYASNGGDATLGEQLVYNIKDTVSNILNYNVNAGGAAFSLADYQAGATSIAISDPGVVVPTADSLLLLTKFDKVYSINHKVAILKVASASTLDGAVTVTVTDNATNLISDDGVTLRGSASLDKVVVKDLLANLTDALKFTAALKADTDAIVITDTTLDASNAADVNALAAIAPTTYSVIDAYADIVTNASAAVKTMVAGAKVVTVDSDPGNAGVDTLSVAQFNTLKGATSGNVVANLSDSFANLAASDAATAITAVKANTADYSTSVLITSASIQAGAATVDQSQTLVARGVALANGGDKLDVADTAANIQAINKATFDALVANGSGSTITVSDNGLVTLTVAQAAKIFDNGGATDGSSYGNYILQDTAANLAELLDNDATGDNVALYQLAKGVIATDPATAAEAALLNSKETMGSVTYSVKDSATAVAGGDTSALNKATSIEVTGNATVDQAEVINALTSPKTFSISDSAANIGSVAGGAGFASAAVRDAVLKAATNIDVTGTGAGALSVANAKIVLAAGNAGTTTIAEVGGTAADLATLTLAAGKNIASLVASTAAKAGEAAAIVALKDGDTTVSCSISDTAAAVAAASATVRNNATNITATGNASASDAATIAGSTAATKTYSISDTAQNLFGLASSVLNGATTITATTDATVAQAAKLTAATPNNADTVFNISDSFANLMADTSPDGTVDNANAIADAGKVTVTDASLTVEQAAALRGVSNSPTYVYAVVDNDNAIKGAATGNAAAQAVLTGATSVVGSQGIALSFTTVGLANVFGVTGTKAQLDALSSELATLNRIYKVSVADLVANESFYSTLGASQYIIVQDTAANLLSGNALLAAARQIVVDGEVTAAQASQISALSALDTTSYTVRDTATALSGIAGAVLNNATKIIATTDATVTEAANIVNATATAANTEFSVTGTATAIATAAADVRDGAINITATGTANNAEASALLGAANKSATTIAAASMTAAEAKALVYNATGDDKITALTVTGNTNVDQATEIVGDVTAGDVGSVVFDLNDTAVELNKASATVLNAAKTITASTDVTLDLAAKLDAATASDANTTYEIADTAANILAAAPALFARGATNVGGEGNKVKVTDTTISADTAKKLIALDAQYNTVSGNQAAAFQIANSAGVVGSFNISDVYANLMPGGSAESGVAGAATIKVTDAVSVAQAAALDTASTATITVSTLRDVYSALFVDGTTRSLATSIDITNASISASQAVTAFSWKAGATTAVSYNVASTAGALATVLAGASAAAITSSSAKTVTVSGTATVDQARYLSEVSKITYAISDNATNIQAALDTANGNNVADRETVLGASSVTVTGFATVDQALGKAGTEDRGLYTLGSKVTYSIQDTGAAIAAGLKGIDAMGIYQAQVVRLNSNLGLSVLQASALTALHNFVGYDGAGAFAIFDYFGAVQVADLALLGAAKTVRANGTSSAELLDLSVLDRAVYVNGNGGNDALYGTEYADIIDGGSGADILSGGNGRDSFWIDMLWPGDNSISAWDKITDFTLAASNWVRAAANDTVAEFQASTVGGGETDIIDFDTTAVLSIEPNHAASTSTTLGSFAEAVKTSIGASGTITVAVANGLMTISSTVTTDLDELSEWVAAAASIAATPGETLAFEFGGNSYIFTHDTASDSLVELTAVTGVAGVSMVSGTIGDVVGGAGYIIIG